MDKMNVISITSDIDALNRDMQDWSFLPMELKMRSNDESIRQYGMTVPELYNKLKLDILKAADKDIPSNIKPLGNDAQVELESATDGKGIQQHGTCIVSNYVDFEYEDLDRSKELQKNPLIVIIDPNDTEEDVATKIASYNALTEKFKRLSDSYSFELYGFNVRNMYRMVLSGIWTMDVVEYDNYRNTIIVGESTESLSAIENYEAIVAGEEDFVNEAFMNGNFLAMAKYISETDEIYKENGAVIASDAGVRNAQLRKAISEVSVPSTAMPWYTPMEQIMRGITPNIASDKRYLLQIKEAMDEYRENPCDETINRVLELGWNYEIDINPGSIQAAKSHYISELNKVKVYDIRNFNEYDMIDHQEGDPYPVFFIIYPDNQIRMSLDSDLLRSVAPAGSKGVNLAGPGKVYVTFVKSLEDLDVEKFKSYQTLELFDKLIKPDYTKEQASKVIEAIAQMSINPLVYNKYHYNVYLVYDGFMSSYDYKRTDQILNTLLHHVDELLKENGITSSLDYFKDMINPTIL